LPLVSFVVPVKCEEEVRERRTSNVEHTTSNMAEKTSHTNFYRAAFCLWMQDIIFVDDLEQVRMPGNWCGGKFILIFGEEGMYS
jgi:hypothetical protein